MRRAIANPGKFANVPRGTCEFGTLCVAKFTASQTMPIEPSEAKFPTPQIWAFQKLPRFGTSPAG